MEKPRLNRATSSLKCGVTAFLLLSGVGFVIAGLMSHQHYGLDHARTVVHYLGDEASGGMQMAKLYSQLLQAAHVHSFTMPLVFFTLWTVLHFTPIRSSWKNLMILGGTLSILAYNAAPFLVRYQSPHYVGLFTVGGVGLFLFFFLPAGLVLYETWLGFSVPRDS